MAEIGITLDELLAELEKLSGESPEGFSTAEMAEHLGRSAQWCRQQLRRLIPMGKARYVGTKRVARIDGHSIPIPIYQFIQDGQK